jgi:hypothetical protein
MKAYERATNSTMNRSGCKLAGLAVNLSVYPAVTMANRENYPEEPKNHHSRVVSQGFAIKRG